MEEKEEIKEAEEKESVTETKTAKEQEGRKKSKATPILIAVIIILVLAIFAVLVYFLNQEPETEAVRKIGMEAGIVANETDAANIDIGEPFSFTTLYERDIYITNGHEATCYIGNSEANYYEDMYIQIFLEGEDGQMGEEIYLSQIIPRGSHIESFETERDLEPGDYVGTLVHSCVNEKGELAGDTPVVVEIHVTE